MIASNTFVEKWHEYSIIGAYIFFGLSLLILLIYFIRVFTIRSRSKKYDFILQNEAKQLWYAVLSAVIAAAILLNGLFEKVLMLEEWIEFTAEFILMNMVAATVGYVFYAYFKYYYSTVIEKKLHKLRFTPRVSPTTGNSMRLLTEDEEDVHLTKEMIEDEASFAYEFDVWIDEKTGYKIIEKYEAHLHALVCPKCNFRTLREQNEDVIKSPSKNEDGLLKKHYACTYCGHKEDMEAKIAMLTTS